MPKHKFIKKKIEVEQFVSSFLTIDSIEIKTQLDDLIVNSTLDISVQKKEGNTMLGGINFDYNYCFY